MKLPLRVLHVLCLGVMTLGVCAAAQSASEYDTLVQQGKTQLQSGNNDAALASASAAIKLNANRWEAYAIAGGALMNLKRYEEAADQLGHAIDHAPEAKQPVLRDLRKQCLLAEASYSSLPNTSQTSPRVPAEIASDGPSYADTVKWLQDNFKVLESSDSSTVRDVPGVTSAHSVAGSGNSQYKFSIDSCVCRISSLSSGTTTLDGKVTDTLSDELVYKFPIIDLIDVEVQDDNAEHMPKLILKFSNSFTITRTMRDSDQPTEVKEYHMNSVDIYLRTSDARDLAPHLSTAFKHLAAICKANPNQKKTDMF